jgi:hypothetical protein
MIEFCVVMYFSRTVGFVNELMKAEGGNEEGV